MNTKDLVHGSLIAQRQSGGDLLDVINSDAFRRMPIEHKVDFIHGYAKEGGPEPQPASKAERLKYILGSSASTGAAGAMLGGAYHIAKGGFQDLAAATPKDMLGMGDPKVMHALDLDNARLISRMKTPLLLGAAIGAGAGYFGSKDRENDKKYIRDTLHNIRTGVSPNAHAAALLFNKEKLDKRRSEGFHTEGVSSQMKTLKETIYPFGVK